MAGLAEFFSLRGGRSWRCNFVVMVSSTTSSRRFGPASFDPGGRHQDSQEQLLEDLVSNPSEWCDNRLVKRMSRYPDFRHKRTGVGLWLDNPGKPEWVDSRLPTLAPQLQKGLGGPESADALGHAFRTLCKQGELDSALDVLLRMDQEGSVPSVDMYRVLLKACIKHKALVQARRVQACLSQEMLESSEVLGEDFVSSLVKCGGIETALEVFDSLPRRSVFCWTAIISGYANAGKGQEALRMYKRMQDENVQPNPHTFVGLLKACGSIPDLKEGKRIHAEVLKFGCESHLFVVTSLVGMYGKCGSIEVAQDLFDRLAHRDVVTWNAMLTAYVEQGQAQKALQLYERMREEGVSPDSRSFVSTLQACGILAVNEKAVLLDGRLTKPLALERGESIHADARRKGFDADVFVGNTLISMYGKCGSIVDAQAVFDQLSQRDVVTWTVMIAALVDQGQPEKGLQLYEEMRDECLTPSSRTFVSVIQACGMLADKEEYVQVDGRSIKTKSLKQGEAIHLHARRKGHDSDVFVGSTLVSMYGKCGSIVDAQIVFDRLYQRNVVTWNALLGAFVEQGQAEKALQLYERMQEEDMSPDNRTFVTMLQACSILADKEKGLVDGEVTKVRSLEIGKAMHTDIRKKGYHTDVYVGNTLITMYGKCGSIIDAWSVFDGLSDRNVVTWTAIITAYVEQKQADMALQLFEQMLKEDLSPDNWTVVSALQACGMLADKEENVIVGGQSTKANSLKKVVAIHEHARKRGYDLDVFVASILVSMYGKCGSIQEAQNVFSGLSHHDVVTWNAMLAAYVEQGQADAALQLYDRMKEQGICPDDRSFVSTLQACGMLASKEDDVVIDGQSTRVMCLKRGEAVHDDARKTGYDSDVFVGNTLVSMYGKCGSIINAQNVFDGLSNRDVVSWNVMLAAYVEQDEAEKALQLYERMQNEGPSPDSRTFVSTLQACGMLADKEEKVLVDMRAIKVKSLEKGEAIHANCRHKGYDTDIFVSSTLVSVYGKCGSIENAETVFNGLSHRNVVTWNAMLTAYLEQKEPEKALYLYEQMRQDGISPDSRTLVSSLQACGMLAEREEGQLVGGQSIKLKSFTKGEGIHADARTKGYDSDVFVGNTLISMYGKCGSIVDAKAVFDNLSHLSVVTWNAMLAAYIEQEQGENALDMYERMRKEGVSPDSWSLVGALQACGMIADKEEYVVVDGQPCKVKSVKRGQILHADAKRMGYESDAFIGTALVSMYGKCWSLVEAQNVFDGLPQRDVVSWNAMLAACAEQGQADKAFELYTRMQQEGTSPNDITIVCLLHACGRAGSLSILKQIHHSLVASGNDLSPLMANTLMSAYGRCARMTDVQTIFDALPRPELVSWNALITAHARQGNCLQSLECFEKMQSAGVAPDRVTFLSLLSACSHGGLVEKGAEYFESMIKDHGIAPDGEHYVCMVDILGRAGCFQRLKELLSTMPTQPDLAMWLCVMGACQKHGEISLGERAFACALQIDPEHAAAYELMSNIYADAGLLDRARTVKRTRQVKSAWKKPGLSWIEIKHEIQSFLVGDRRHPEHRRVYAMLRLLDL